MAQQTRLDLLLKEIEDRYVQENFRKLGRYLECLESGVAGPRGLQGPVGAPGQDGTADHTYLMDVPASVIVGDVVYQDYSQVNFANVFATNDSPSPFIGVVVSKDSSTEANVQYRGLLDTVLTQGPVFMSETGDLQLGVPSTGKWQRMGFSLGNGKLWLEPERIRIRNT